MHDLMEAIDEHFERLVTAVREEKPEAAAHPAWIVAELSNVNQFNRDAADYRQWARAVRDLSVRLAKAAQAEDLAACRRLAKQVSATCRACHDRYRKH